LREKIVFYDGQVVILSPLLEPRDRPKSKQLEAIRNLGEEAFSFKFEDSELLASLIQGCSLGKVKMFKLTRKV
jgi:hypothetical protein